MAQSKRPEVEHGTHSRQSPSLELATLMVCLVESGSIAAAGRRLNIDPSLATRKLAQLENVFDVRLFERTTRTLRLTEAGAIALQWARETLDSFAQTQAALSDLASQPVGQIRIAASQYVATVYLPPILERFSQKYPGITYSITSTDSLVNVVEDQFDLTIHSGRIPNSRMIGLRIREFHRILCASPQYLERKGTPSSPADLAKHNCLVHSTNEPKCWHFMRGESLIAQPVSAVVEADSYATLLQFARSSMGIARLARNLAESDLKSGRLVQVLSGYRSVYSTGEVPGLWVLYPHRRLLHRTRLLVDFLTQELKLKAGN